MWELSKHTNRMPSDTYPLNYIRGVSGGPIYSAALEKFYPTTLVCLEYFESRVKLGALTRVLGGDINPLLQRVRCVVVAFIYLITKIVRQPQ